MSGEPGAASEQVFDPEAIALNAVLPVAAKSTGGGVAKRKLKANSTVYVRGLPHDATESEVLAWAKKAGVVRIDPETELPKVKLYRGDDGSLKGDASITYLFPESVQQAVLLLDGDQFRHGFLVSVEPAQFGASRPRTKDAARDHDHNDGGVDHDDEDVDDPDAAASAAKKPRTGKARAQKLTVHEQQLRALDWDEEIYKKRHVILKRMFAPADIEPTDLEFYADLKNEVRSECEKLGPVESVHVFEGSPDGVVAIKFVDWLGADRCIRAMNGRWFDQRQVIAEYYDGKSDYSVGESAEARAARDAAFASWLDGDDTTATTTNTNTTTTTTTKT